MLDRDFLSKMKRLRKTLEEGINSSNTTVEHRERLKQDLETLERITVDRYMERIKSIKIRTEADFQK